MTATPATAATHMHPGGIEHYHDIASARELRLHIFYGHDDGVGMPFVGLAEVGDDRDELTERHRQAHAGDALMERVVEVGDMFREDAAAVARGAELGEAFAGLGRKIPEGPASAAPAPSGQSSEGAAVVSGTAPAAPAGDRSIYLSDGNGTVYLAEPLHAWATPAGVIAPEALARALSPDASQIYRLTIEPTETPEGGDRQGATPAGPGVRPPSGLPAYRPAATCPKCGHDDIDTAYLANGRAYECSCKLRCGERSEHLHRRCRRCTFTWPEAVIKMSALPRPAADTGGEDVTLPAGPPIEARP